MRSYWSKKVWYCFYTTVQIKVKRLRYKTEYLMREITTYSNKLVHIQIANETCWIYIQAILWNIWLDYIIHSASWSVSALKICLLPLSDFSDLIYKQNHGWCHFPPIIPLLNVIFKRTRANDFNKSTVGRLLWFVRYYNNYFLYEKMKWIFNFGPTVPLYHTRGMN